MKPVSTWGQNWQASQGRATTNYVAGVQNYSGDWAAATTAQQSTLVTNFTQAVTSGQWARSVQNTGTAGWKSATEAKQSNYGTGFGAGVNNYNAAANKVAGALQAGLASLPARGDINQNLQRSAALALYMHSKKGTLGAKD